MSDPTGTEELVKRISQRLSHPSYEHLGEDQHLEPLFPDGSDVTLEAWERLRRPLRARWEEALGHSSFGEFDKSPRIVGRFEQPRYRGTVFRQPTGPDTQQLVVLLEPSDVSLSPRPGAVVPYYHPDLMAGFDLERGERVAERPNVQFGRHLVQQGYVVVCTEAFPYNTAPEPKQNVGFAWWEAAAEKLLADNPHWTGMGKLVWDTSRAVDLLLSQPNIDAGRVAIIGHSLGGKMAFYAGALDERIGAIIASDFGIGWDFTNWDAPWYLSDQIHDPQFTLAHHQLLALHAPSSFFLIAGQADRTESWQYILEAQNVYRLYGRENAVGVFHHGTGHQPTEESITLAYKWLAEQFDLAEQPWQF